MGPNPQSRSKLPLFAERLRPLEVTCSPSLPPDSSLHSVLLRGDIEGEWAGAQGGDW